MMIGKTRKKSKFKSAIINKKRYYFYSIKWVDITGDAGHATAEEFDKFEASYMITQAYVYKKTKKFKRSNLGQIKKLGLVDKHGRPLNES